jgi:hypothetical protein
MSQRSLLICGLIAPLLFIATASIGGAIRPGYRHLSDTNVENKMPSRQDVKPAR